MKIYPSALFSSKKSNSYLIIGLGNPGKKYINTRHNVGFEMLDVVAKANNIKVSKLKCRAIIGEGNICDTNVILAKPQTYMNLSGESIRELASYYKIPPERIIVIYDDISLDVGKIRIRQMGSAGGHNGMKSIIYQLKTDEFPRVRIGIGKPDCELIDYVLQDFSKKDINELIDVSDKIPQIIEAIISEGIQNAMNKYN